MGLTFASPFLSTVGPEALIINKAGLISLFFLVGIPVLGLIMFLLRVSYKVRISKEVNFTVWSIWFIALFFTFYAGTMTAIDFKKSESLTKKSDYKMDHETITIGELKENLKSDRYSKFVKSPINFYKDSLIFNNVHVQYFETDSSFVSIEQVFSARGMNHEKAQKQIDHMAAPFTVLNNEILISPYIRIPEKNKWREHRVDYKIFIPKGKKVSFNFKNNANALSR